MDCDIGNSDPVAFFPHQLRIKTLMTEMAAMGTEEVSRPQFVKHLISQLKMEHHCFCDGLNKAA